MEDSFIYDGGLRVFQYVAFNYKTLAVDWSADLQSKQIFVLPFHPRWFLALNTDGTPKWTEANNPTTWWDIAHPPTVQSTL